MARGWPLVGRSEELDVLTSRLLADGSAGVLISGAAGVGKTRLAREALTRLAPVAYEWIVASAAARQLPFGAVASLMARPPSGAEPVRTGFPTQQAELVAAVLSALRERGGGTAPVLAVDDAHALDDGSAVVVQQAAISGAARVLLTVRSGEPVPEPIVGLWRDGVVDRLVLQPLSREETASVVQQVLEGEVEAATIDRLCLLSEGNALFLHEIVEDALETKSLSRASGAWTLDAGGIGGSRLRDLVAFRLRNVSEDEHDALELLAVSEPIWLPVLESLVRGPVVAALERRSIVSVDDLAPGDEAPSVRFAHPLYGEVLRSALPVTASRAARRRVAAALPATASNPNDVRRRALWLLETGVELEADEARRAAAAANLLLDHEAAIVLARASLALGGGAEATVELGAALTGSGRPEEAAAVLAPLASITDLPDAVRLAATLERIRALFYGLGRVDETIAMLAEATAGLPRSEASQLDAERAVVLTSAERLAEALPLAEAVLADPEAHPLARVRVLSAACPIWCAAGNTDRALSVTAELLPVGLALTVQYSPALGLVVSNQVAALVYAGRLEDAYRLIDVGEAGLPPWTATRARALAALGRGHIELLRGKPRTAATLLSRARAGFVPADANTFGVWCASLLAESLALVGEIGPARALLREARARPPGPGVRTSELIHASYWVEALDGSREVVAKGVIEIAEYSRRVGSFGFEAYHLHEAVRLGAASQVADRLEELTAVVDGLWIGAFAAHARAGADNDVAALHAVSDEFEAIGATLLAAEAAAEAAGVLSATLGPEEKATRAALARSARLEARCEGARTPALLDSAWPWPLTTREREVARLVAAGMTNRDVAASLFMSVRTVENHLQHVYSKVGVSTRQELSELLGFDAEAPGRTAGPDPKA